VTTTEQLWTLYDVMPERLGAAVLLGALAGLRLAGSCGLRATDVDFMRGIVFPRMQYPAEELKTVIDAVVDSKFRDPADSVRPEGARRDAPPAQRPR
jgi:hypothetical protein